LHVATAVLQRKCAFRMLTGVAGNYGPGDAMPCFNCSKFGSLQRCCRGR